MRNLNQLNLHRLVREELVLYRLPGGADAGVFAFKSPVDDRTLMVVASNGDGWDHVSVSRRNRIPVWKEMEFIRRLFFEPYEAVMQLHAPLAEYVDGSRLGDCENCLHLWRPHDQEIPIPPKWMISVSGLDPEDQPTQGIANVDQ